MERTINAPVDGKCGSGADPRAPACDYGTYVSDPSDSDIWTCEGKNNGEASDTCGSCDPTTKCCEGNTNPPNTNCPLVINGVCSTTDPSGCDPGDLEKKSATTYICKGKDGGKDSGLCGCPTQENGQCSPTGCSKGAKKDNTDGTWYCQGQCGGIDSADPCPLPGGPTCNDTGCSKGTKSTNSNGTYSCVIGTDSVCCPKDGKCSDAGCEVGTKQDDGNRWKCIGLCEGGDSATCGEEQPPCASPPIDGVCSGDGCDAGTQQDNGDGTWVCKGIAGEILKNGTCTSVDGNDSSDCGDPDSCTGDPPVDGLCSDDGCSAGTPNPSSPDTDGTWTCEDIAGEIMKNGTCTSVDGKDKSCGCGVSKDCCPEGTDGECSDTGCSAGTQKNNNNGTWVCEGTSSQTGCPKGGDSPTCGCESI